MCVNVDINKHVGPCLQKHRGNCLDLDGGNCFATISCIFFSNLRTRFFPPPLTQCEATNAGEIRL